MAMGPHCRFRNFTAVPCPAQMRHASARMKKYQAMRAREIRAGVAIAGQPEVIYSHDATIAGSYPITEPAGPWNLYPAYWTVLIVRGAVWARPQVNLNRDAEGTAKRQMVCPG